jgi:hypothetical protein
VNGSRKQGENLFKAVILIHIILFLHLLIIAGLVLMVIFLRGITEYMLWIFLGVAGLFILSALLIYRRIKSKGKEMIHDIENSTLFQGRSFEVSFLRGMASLKFGRSDELKTIQNPSVETKFQLEDPETARIRELTELARMYEKKLITSEEYKRAKDQVLKLQ